MGKGFRELEVYREACELRRRVYRLIAQLPDDERFNLTSQMRRAATSVTNCIDEGHGSRSYKHNISYLYRARGSLCELIDDFGICEDQHYFEAHAVADIQGHAESVIRLINGYIRYLRGREDASS